MQNGDAKPNFAMPEIIGRSPYAPRVQSQVEEVLHEVPALDLRHTPRGADAIKSWLKVLTHREMREFVAEIFAAHARLYPKPDASVLAPAITAAQLADVLDTVAGD